MEEQSKRRVLMAWELGGGMGHAARLAALSRGLSARSRVTLALRDLTQAAWMPADVPATVVQAPLWLPEARGLPEAASYAELLFRFGFLDARRLLPVVRAWRALIEANAPDLLLVDHAPTALLAARGLAVKRALVGTGFFCPPPVRPMPAFRIWEAMPPGRLEQAEAVALATANTVLDALGAPRLAQLSDLLAADENFLTTWPELDHYRPRLAGTRYWGPEALMDAGAPAAWPPGEGPRVFVYLKAVDARVGEVLKALGTQQVRTLAFVDGLPEAARMSLQGPRLAISAQPVRMSEACAQADGALCNANSGTVSAMLQAGKPVLLWPLQAEQYLFGLRVAETGAGTVLDPARPLPAQVKRWLPALAPDSAARQAAQALAARYPDQDIGGTLDRVVQRCVALMDAGA